MAAVRAAGGRVPVTRPGDAAGRAAFRPRQFNDSQYIPALFAGALMTRSHAEFLGPETFLLFLSR